MYFAHLNYTNTTYTHQLHICNVYTESEYKCLTCNQKLTESQFSLLHERN